MKKLLVGLIAVVPLWIVEFPPIQDLPNHLGRAHVILDLLRGGTVFGGEYQLQLLPLPNLAADLFLVPLSAVLPAPVAGKVFLSLVLLLTVAAGFCFLKAAGAPESGWLALPLLWNWFVQMGFLSFALSVPLALYAWAWFLERRGRWGNRERLVFGLLATALWFAHLFSFVFLVAAVQLGKARRGRWHHLLRLEPGFLPGLCCWALLFALETKGPGYVVYPDPEWKALLLANLFVNHQPAGDLALFGLVVAGVAWSARALRRVWLAPAGLALAGFLVLPRAALGGYWVDARMLIFLAFLILAALEVSCRRARLAGTVLLVLVTAWTGRAFLAEGREIGGWVRAADALPRGARVVPLSEKEDPGAVETYHHVVTWTVSRRDTVTPYLFAKPYQHPVRAVADRTAPHEYWFHGQGDPPDLPALGREWDFAWLTGPPGALDEELEAAGGLFLRRGDLRIYRLRSTKR